MHTTTIFSVLTASVSFLTLTAAAPTAFPDPTVCPSGTGYYQKCANGFSGCCTVDACSKGWCPNPKEKVEDKPIPPVTGPVCAPIWGKASSYYTCNSNGFKGHCSVDPCYNMAWCPDFETKSCTPAKPVIVEPPRTEIPPTTSVCAPIAGKASSYYTCNSNGFKGHCSVDPCYNMAWCPDFEAKTCTPVPVWKPEPVPEPTPKKQTQQYVCSSNGFNGQCSVDACNLAWCPDYEYKTYTPVV